MNWIGRNGYGHYQYIRSCSLQTPLPSQGDSSKQTKVLTRIYLLLFPKDAKEQSEKHK